MGFRTCHGAARDLGYNEGGQAKQNRGRKSSPENFSTSGIMDKPGWWQLKDVLFFTPLFGEDEPILTSMIFQMGWFNHQLVNVTHFFFWGGGGRV